MSVSYIRYGLLGVQEDILEARQLAASGGAGPVGPDWGRLYWTGAEWSSDPPAKDEGEKRWRSTAPQKSTNEH